MIPGVVASATLWGLPKWSPDHKCQEDIAKASIAGSSLTRAPEIRLADVSQLLLPMAEEDPNLIAGWIDDQQENCGGILVSLFQDAPNVGAMLSVLLRYNPLHAAPVVYQVRPQGEHIFLSVWVERGDAHDEHAAEIITVLALLQVVSGLGAMTEGAFKPHSINLAPSNHSLCWPSHFHSIPINVDSPESGLLIHRDILSKPNPSYRKGQLPFVREADSALEAYRKGDLNAVLKSEIKGWIRATLPTGRYQLTRLAERMHCDKRTLQRRLARDLGVTFQCLLDESRDEVVLPMLRSGVFSVNLISNHAGFSNTGNFSRYFSQRFGCSPLSWCAAQESR
ncbi:MAG: AraC family transcriptional regulator [Luminiphilus sp.]|nr:AraC family transcriptional regulator [Luminiphilus sp.]